MEEYMNKRTRSPKGEKKEICAKCDNKIENPKKRYCNKCSAKYVNDWRKNHKPTQDQKFKSNVRRKTLMRVKRGLLKKFPCEVCNDEKVEAHHDDYSQPYKVRWLCKFHHREHHKMEKDNVNKTQPMGLP